MVQQGSLRLHTKSQWIQRRCRKRVRVDNYSRQHTLDVYLGFFGAGILEDSLAHQLQGVPCCQAVIILGLLGFEVFYVRLKAGETLPMLIRQSVILTAEEKLQTQADCVWKDIGVKRFEDFAFETVTLFPGRGLTVLGKLFQLRNG